MTHSTLRAWLLAGTATLVPHTLAVAQETEGEDPAAAQQPAPEQATPQEAAPVDQTTETIVVTGTRVRRSSFDTPSSIASIGDDNIRRFTAGSGSQADILQNLPGVNAEGGGGEVATNFRVRGLPSAGQFEFTPLQVDGVSVFSTFGLNSSAFDFFVRNDLGIQRLEFNKSGVANLFGAGGQAGVLNYVSKTGTYKTEGTFQLEYAEGNRFRSDFAVQGPISDTTFYAVSGFYRYDEGPLDSGLPTEGFAVRANVRQEFGGGSGYFQVNAAYINDRAQFFLPTVLDGQDRDRIDGNDGETVFTLNSSDVAGLTARTPEGITSFDAGNGFRTVGGHIYATLEKDFGDGWKLGGKVKFTILDTGSNFFNNGAGPDGGGPFTQDEFLDSVGLAGQTAAFSFAREGGVLAPTDLVYVNQFNDRERDATDGTIELNLSKELEFYGMKHTFTLGAFIARAEADNIQRSVRYLVDFTNNPDLVNVTLPDASDPDNPFNLTLNGILQAPSAYANQTREAFRRAVYFADQVQADRWQFDIGVRIEAQTVKNRFEDDTTIAANVTDKPVAGSAITQQRFGTGEYFEGDATATGWAVAAAASYLITDDLNIYANGSRGFFFPQAQSTGGQIRTTGDIAIYDEEPILQAALGVKYKRGRLFSGYIEAFFTGLRDRNNVLFDDNTAEPNVFSTSSDTFGVEVDARLRIAHYASITGNLVFQSHEVTEGVANPGTADEVSLVGNELVRLPNILANVGVVGAYAGFDGAIFWNFNGSAFADPGNGIELDAFSILRLDAGYSIPVAEADTLRVSINVWNLLNSQGLQEGNPRAGVAQSVGDDEQFFVGRPILPRRVTVRMTYDFF